MIFMSTELQKFDSSAHSLVTPRRRQVRPRYDISEDADTVRVRVFLPGVPKDQAAVTTNGDTLTIEAQRPNHWQDSWQRTYQEISDTDYRLDLELNRAIDREKITASTRDGLLLIDMPIAAEAKARTIAIA